MKKILCLLAFLLALYPALYAQNVDVSGKVTDENGSAISRASVVEKRTRKGTTTDAEGNFHLSIKQGSTLLVTFVGYGSKEIIANASGTFNVRLAPGSTALNEVVVTALGIRREKKALGYAVSTINKKDLELKPEGDIGRLLSGKAPGVNILATSGLSGSGTNIVIRGINTITGSDVAPLFIVDGVPFDASTRAQSNFEYGNQTSSRFLDLDPNSIESINILKGLSATTLYGQRGRNGVIVVTTKNGASIKNNKKFEVTVSQSFFANKVANLPEYQNTWGGGFNLQPSFAFSNWGAKFTDPVQQLAHPYDRSALNIAFPEYVGATYNYKPYNSVKNFFRTGLVSNTSIGVSAGGSNTSLSATYSYLDDKGFTPGNSVQKNNMAIGGNAKLSNNFTLSGTVNYVITDFKSPVTSPSFGSSAVAASIFGDLIYTPRSIDLMGLPYKNPLTGGSVYYRAGNDIQNPRWTAENALTQQKANRSFGNFQLRYDIFKNFNISYKFGFDFTNELHSLTINKGGVSGSPKYQSGIYRTVNGASSILDHTILGNYNKNLGTRWTLNVDAGINSRSDAYEQSGMLSSQQLVFGLFKHSNFISHDANGEDAESDPGASSNLNYEAKQKELGIFLQTSIGFKDLLYLTVGGRNSWVSTLEKENRSLFYPSTSISFIPTTAISALNGSKALNYLKLRAGYSTSARFPEPYFTRDALNIRTNAFVDRSGNVVNLNVIPNRLPNPNLRPELQQEVELGLESRMFNNRINLDFTVYRRISKDQILDRQLDPSTGYTEVKTNAGSLRNQGIEIALGYTVIRGKKWRWQLDGNFSANRSKVYNMPSDVKQIVIAGYTNLGTIAAEGQPLGVIYGGYAIRDVKSGQLVVDGNGDYIYSEDSKIIGNPNPDYKLNGISTLSYRSLSMRMQWDFTKGGQMYSGTVRALLARGLTRDTDFDRYLPIVLPGVKEDGTPNDIQTSVTNAYFNSLGFGPDDRSIYDATVVRLREVSLSYSLPDNFLKKTPFGSASFSVSGQNLWYYAPNFPKYMNFDPETTSLGVGNSVGGLELLTGPTSKRFGISFKASF
ncbi:SusC/RagA family TonB-linked outer membrane protein [soil metagenome]